VRGGKQLCVLDDLVLNVGRYASRHPGGKFLIDATVGRDVSKYFYGGYKMENSKSNRDAPYRHSMMARKCIPGLVYARLNEKAMTAEAGIIEKTDIVADTKAFTFECTDKAREVWSLFYQDIQMIGRHFLLTNTRVHSVQRQYTVCSSMRKPVHDGVVAQLKAAVGGTFAEVDKGLFDDVAGSKICFSVKTYHTEQGLATDLFEDKFATYSVKGPMGAGLCMHKGGVHVAFCGGTGLLVYVDLVVHLARRMLATLSEKENQMVSDDFKFILYASFPSKEKTIALELCDLTAQLAKKLGKDCFEVRWRFSSESKDRWDKDFVVKALQEIKKVERLWVCGPPPMNEAFEKILALHHQDVGLEKSDYDIM